MYSSKIHSRSKISYCITCKGRLHHLRQTLRHNLLSEEDNRNVEFVLLDYDSQDGLADWIKQNFAAEIEARRLVYAYHTPAPYFKMAHAKNLAHRIASGDILCNLDSDNFIPLNFGEWLRNQFYLDDRITISSRRLAFYGYIEERIVARLLGLSRPMAGTHGRIAVSRENFLKLGGYDESYTGWGGDDIEFQLRARKQLGLKAVRIPKRLWGNVIEHGRQERINNLSDEDKKISIKRLKTTIIKGVIVDWQRHIRQHGQSINDGNFGVGNVCLNFGEQYLNMKRIESSPLI